MKTVEERVHAIMEAFAVRWRWFCEGTAIVLEPPQGCIAAETMLYLHKHTGVHSVEAVFRATPHPGVYLRFCLREITP